LNLKNSVLSTTLETIQVGEAGEKDQRIVTLNELLLQSKSENYQLSCRLERLKVLSLAELVFRHKIGRPTTRFSASQFPP